MPDLRRLVERVESWVNGSFVCVLIIHHCNCGTEVCRTCAGEVAATFGSEQEQIGKGRKSKFGFGALLRAGSLLIRSVRGITLVTQFPCPCTCEDVRSHGAEAQARQTFIHQVDSRNKISREHQTCRRKSGEFACQRTPIFMMIGRSN